MITQEVFEEFYTKYHLYTLMGLHNWMSCVARQEPRPDLMVAAFQFTDISTRAAQLCIDRIRELEA